MPVQISRGKTTPTTLFSEKIDLLSPAHLQSLHTLRYSTFFTHSTLVDKYEATFLLLLATTSYVRGHDTVASKARRVASAPIHYFGRVSWTTL